MVLRRGRAGSDEGAVVVKRGDVLVVKRGDVGGLRPDEGGLSGTDDVYGPTQRAVLSTERAYGARAWCYAEPSANRLYDAMPCGAQCTSSDREFHLNAGVGAGKGGIIGA
eukprot:1440269-Rhodomonas_salina.1